MQNYVFEMFICATLKRNCKSDKSCEDKIKYRLDVGTYVTLVDTFTSFIHVGKLAASRRIRKKKHGISKLYILFTLVIRYRRFIFFFLTKHKLLRHIGFNYLVVL